MARRMRSSSLDRSCTRRLSSKRQHQKYFRLSQAPPAICSQFSMPCSRTQRGSVRRATVRFGFTKTAARCAWPRCMGGCRAHFVENGRVGTLHRPSSSVPTARVFETGKPVQIIDLKEDRSYAERDPLAVASVDVGGIRSLIAVPMLKDAAVVGVMTIYRREVRPFADKQIELGRELCCPGRHRHRERAAAQRTAPAHRQTSPSAPPTSPKRWSSRLLRRRCSRLSQALPAILSRYLQPCWRTLFASATPRLEMFTARDGEAFISWHRTIRQPSLLKRASNSHHTARPLTSFGERLMATKSAIHIADLAADEDYIERNPAYSCRR